MVAVVADGLVSIESPSAITDDAGYYTITGIKTLLLHGPLMSASKPGYFTDVKWAGIAVDTVDFDLVRLTYVSLGSVVQSRMTNALCAGLGYGGIRGPCHRFAVLAPETGILEVMVSAPSINGDLDVWGPNGTSALYFPCPCTSPVHLTVRAEKGATYEIRVTLTPEIELTTAFRASQE
jgi:hypothetical protein